MLLIYSKLIIPKKLGNNSCYVTINSIKIKKNIIKTILIIKIKILQQTYSENNKYSEEIKKIYIIK